MELNKNILPSHWRLMKLGEVCTKISLNKIKIKQKDYLSIGEFPVIDQGQELIGGYYNEEKLIVPDEPPYIIFGDHTRVKKYINFKFIAGADGVKVLKPHSVYDPKFFFYLIHTIKIPDKGYARHFQFLEKEVIPIPPLPEQQAIVAKIEELLSELENGKKQLLTAQQQLKVYRQSLLKAAFEGKLVKHKAEWKKLKLGEVANAVDPQPSHRTPPIVPNGIPYASIKDFDSELDRIDLTNARKVSPDILKEHKKRYTLQKGDFVIGKIGTIGKPVRVLLPQNYSLSANIVLIQPRKVNSTYLYYFFQSNQIEKAFKAGTKATTQAAFGIQKVRELEIDLPDENEQQLIVSELESKLTVCDKIEETISQSLLQAETLRQSILKKAFEGKLVGFSN